MDKKLIGKMQKAGVSADVILALMLDEEEQTPPAEAEQTPPAEAEQTPPAESKAAAPAGNDAILAAISKLTGAIQASNIINSRQNGPKPQSVDEILAGVLGGNPPEGGK